jgi:curli biogenesis system outer membrane secretion channel CsgG
MLLKTLECLSTLKLIVSLGGNNALLYACANSGKNIMGGQKHDENEDGYANQANYMLVSFLIDEAGADPEYLKRHSLKCSLTFC